MTWLGFALLLAVALLCVAWPLRNRGREGAVTAGSSADQIALFRAREQELADQLAAGDIDSVQREALLDEARRQLLADAARAAAARTGGGWLLGAAAVLVVGLALAGYLRLGGWPDLALRDLLAGVEASSSAQIRDRIRQRLRAVPEHTTYWLMLARLEQAAGEVPAALVAYRQVLEREPDSTAVRAEYAQALFLAAGNQITPAIRGEVERVLAIRPDNPVALSLHGIDAFQHSRYQDAIDTWQRVLDAAPDSAEAAAVATAIAAAHARLGVAAPPPMLRVAVGLAPGVTADPETPVFIFVREWQGQPMPVAARRLRVADLPANVAFTAGAGLDPERTLASIERFEVVARLSRSGSAAPAPGDLEIRAGPFERTADPRDIELILAP